MIEEFPDLTIITNDRTLIEPYELDIIMPELSFAIEWNGIFHFKPIGGKRKLEKIQRNDAIKKMKLQAMGWDFYIAESHEKYKEKVVYRHFKRIRDKIKSVKDLRIAS